MKLKPTTNYSIYKILICFQINQRYLQAYMDRKKINEDVMKKYLKELSPFESYPEPAKYPILDVEHVRPKW